MRRESGATRSEPADLDASVRDDPERSRYELVAGDVVLGYLDYRRRGGAVILPHTMIAPEQRGRGLGAVLVQGALDDLRRRGEEVEARCWYVRDFIEDHPAYRSMLAA